ncbi:MAG: hypothetical protein CMJ75_00915 [Planctomycetaceae bacterium]|nr:hypothetical protein [Planctomycetaceae bacterium]
MSLILATQFSAFLTGLIMGTCLLGLGIFIGFWPNRAGHPLIGGSRAESNRTFEVLAHLCKWTDRFATDVSQYRDTVDRFAAQCAEFDKENPTLKNTSLTTLLTQVVEANNNVQERLEAAESKLLNHSHEIAASMEAARIDPVTGLPNRRSCDDELQKRFESSSRFESALSILLFDIDHFKSFNDAYGHLAGDAILRQVAGRFKLPLDAADFVGRFGGEEFVILLSDHGHTAATAIAREVCEAVAATSLHYDKQVFTVTISGGVSSRRPDESLAELLKRADAALYAAKDAGRNCIWQHDDNGLTGATHPATRLSVISGVPTPLPTPVPCLNAPKEQAMEMAVNS